MRAESGERRAESEFGERRTQFETCIERKKAPITVGLKEMH